MSEPTSTRSGRAVPTVETVRGPVDVAELGPTLMHEHIFVLDPQALENYGHAWGESYWDEDVRVADAIQKLRRLRDGGIHTLVDPTVPGLGRSIPRIQRINAEVISTSSSRRASTSSSSCRASSPIAPTT